MQYTVRLPNLVEDARSEFPPNMLSLMSQLAPPPTMLTPKLVEHLQIDDANGCL